MRKPGAPAGTSATRKLPLPSSGTPDGNVALRTLGRFEPFVTVYARARKLSAFGVGRPVVTPAAAATARNVFRRPKPWLGSLMLSVVFSMIDLICAGARPGAIERMSATVPVTCGVACDVPANSAAHSGGLVPDTG